MIQIVTRGAYPDLMEAGVKIYEYTPGFIHSKQVLADDEVAVVGTINFDYRSLVHHYENAVWMYRSPRIDQDPSGLWRDFLCISTNQARHFPDYLVPAFDQRDYAVVCTNVIGELEPFLGEGGLVSVKCVMKYYNLFTYTYLRILKG